MVYRVVLEATSLGIEGSSPSLGTRFIMNTTIKKLGDITTALNPIACIVFILFYFDYKVLIGFIITYAIGNILCQCIKGICDAKRPRDGGSHEVITIKPYSHEDGES